MPDPRRPRGIRHTLASVLLTSVAAVLAGARSFAAIGEWAADAPPGVLAALGTRFDPLAGRFVPPGETTIRRVLESVDAGRLDAAVTSWLASAQSTREDGGRRAVAVDGKALRGTRHVAADGQAEFLVTRKNAHYILVVKRNQPGLHGQLAKLPWKSVPVAARQRDRGHGRQEDRALQVVTVTAGLAFPHAAQAIQVTRRTRPLAGGRRRTATIYAVTSLPFGQAAPPS